MAELGWVDKRRHSNIMKYDIWNVLNIWFFFYVAWAGRVLVQEMWFENYFIWNAAKLTMEKFRMKKLHLKIFYKYTFLFSNNLNEKLTACLR